MVAAAARDRRSASAAATSPRSCRSRPPAGRRPGTGGCRFQRDTLCTSTGVPVEVDGPGALPERGLPAPAAGRRPRAPRPNGRSAPACSSRRPTRGHRRPPSPPPSSSMRGGWRRRTPSRSTGSTPSPCRPSRLAQFEHDDPSLSRSRARRRRSRRSRGRAGRPPSRGGCSGTAWCASARPGPAGSGELSASMPASSAIRSARMACHGSLTSTALVQPCSANAADTARMLSSVSTPSGTASRASPGTPGAGQVVAAGLGLGELVPVGLAADGHDHRRDAVLVEGDRVLQPGLEDRRRDAVVLRRAEHHDRVGGRAGVLPRGPPDRQRGGRRSAGRRPGRRQRRPGPPGSRRAPPRVMSTTQG